LLAVLLETATLVGTSGVGGVLGSEEAGEEDSECEGEGGEDSGEG
jgi:hypothetical protein